MLTPVPIVRFDTTHRPGDNLARFNAGIAQLVERNLAKVEVASSRLVSRSSHAVTRSWSRLEQVQRRGGRVVMQRPAKP